MKIAIVGASGAVGQELLKILEQRNFPVTELTLFGSSRSAGSYVTFKGNKHQINELTDNSAELFKNIDFAFVSAGASTSKKYAEIITSGNAIMIDNSSAFRMDSDVPLVVPEVNGDDALNATRNIIANPNCTTIQMVVALKPLNDLSRIKKVRVATYQAASGAGAMAMEELKNQHSQIVNNVHPTVDKFSHQLAYNLIPHIDVFLDNDYTKEEMKMFNETRKIMHSSDIKVSATCVRVPVLRAHSEAIWIETEKPISANEAKEAFEQAPGVCLIDNPAECEYPMPLFAADTDPVYVGRIREDLTEPCGLSFWTVSDQIRKGAALNAIQIAEYIINKK